MKKTLLALSLIATSGLAYANAPTTGLQIDDTTPSKRSTKATLHFNESVESSCGVRTKENNTYTGSILFSDEAEFKGAKNTEQYAEFRLVSNDPKKDISVSSEVTEADLTRADSGSINKNNAKLWFGQNTSEANYTKGETTNRTYVHQNNGTLLKVIAVVDVDTADMAAGEHSVTGTITITCEDKA